MRRTLLTAYRPNEDGIDVPIVIFLPNIKSVLNATYNNVVARRYYLDQLPFEARQNKRSMSSYLISCYPDAFSIGVLWGSNELLVYPLKAWT